MKLRALALAASLMMTGNAYATSMNLTDTKYLGPFDGGEIYGETFTVATAGTINHSLTFDITGDLYAGSGVFDISLGNIININGLTANIFTSSNTLTPYASFTPIGGDLLVLPLGTYFGIGSYTLKVGGQATGTGLGGLLPAGAYTVAAVTVPVPEPETWAMLLVGMGLVGLRARQKAKAEREAALA
jgi:hypothetical protein